MTGWWLLIACGRPDPVVSSEPGEPIEALADGPIAAALTGDVRARVPWNHPGEVRLHTEVANLGESRIALDVVAVEGAEGLPVRLSPDRLEPGTDADVFVHVPEDLLRAGSRVHALTARIEVSDRDEALTLPLRVVVTVDGDLDDDGQDARGAGGDDCDDDDPTAYLGAVEVCDDGIDGDCDGRADCEDADCWGSGACGEDCSARGDEDGDALLDCDDDDCWSHPACATVTTTIVGGRFRARQRVVTDVSMFGQCEVHGSLSASWTAVEGVTRVERPDGFDSSCAWTLDRGDARFTWRHQDSTCRDRLDFVEADVEREGLAGCGGSDWFLPGEAQLLDADADERFLALYGGDAHLLHEAAGTSFEGDWTSSSWSVELGGGTWTEDATEAP